MKRILITGKKSYIGSTFEKWLKQFNDEYQVDSISLRDGTWLEKDFNTYDSVIHLAAIVHRKKVDEQEYYRVNKDLAVEVAKKAKKAGVKQFIFFSTMSVFGMDIGIIGEHTKPKPKSSYGKSKLAAEKKIISLADKNFLVAIVRPPMIYGPNAVGNYARISKLAKITPFFPKIDNLRSMLYIDNLHAFLKIIIDNKLSGTFHPQNCELINTSKLVEKIGNVSNHKVFLINGFEHLLKLSLKKVSILKKVFGTLYYDDSAIGFPMSEYEGILLDYQTKNFEESILESER